MPSLIQPSDDSLTESAILLIGSMLSASFSIACGASLLCVRSCCLRLGLHALLRKWAITAVEHRAYPSSTTQGLQEPLHGTAPAFGW